MGGMIACPNSTREGGTTRRTEKLHVLCGVAKRSRHCGHGYDQRQRPTPSPPQREDRSYRPPQYISAPAKLPAELYSKDGGPPLKLDAEKAKGM